MRKDLLLLSVTTILFLSVLSLNAYSISTPAIDLLNGDFYLFELTNITSGNGSSSSGNVTNYWGVYGDWISPNISAGGKTNINVSKINTTTINETSIYSFVNDSSVDLFGNIFKIISDGTGNIYGAFIDLTNNENRSSKQVVGLRVDIDTAEADYYSGLRIFTKDYATDTMGHSGNGVWVIADHNSQSGFGGFRVDNEGNEDIDGLFVTHTGSGIINNVVRFAGTNKQTNYGYGMTGGQILKAMIGAEDSPSYDSKIQSIINVTSVGVLNGDGYIHHGILLGNVSNTSFYSGNSSRWGQGDGTYNTILDFNSSTSTYGFLLPPSLNGINSKTPTSSLELVSDGVNDIFHVWDSLNSGWNWNVNGWQNYTSGSPSQPITWEQNIVANDMTDLGALGLTPTNFVGSSIGWPQTYPEAMPLYMSWVVSDDTDVTQPLEFYLEYAISDIPPFSEPPPLTLNQVMWLYDWEATQECEDIGDGNQPAGNGLTPDTVSGGLFHHERVLLFNIPPNTLTVGEIVHISLVRQPIGGEDDYQSELYVMALKPTKYEIAQGSQIPL